MNRKIAIIDLGSNSVRMNIYSTNEKGGYSVFEQAKEMVRLSEGLEEDGFLKPEPIDRTLKALEYFKMLIKVNEVSQVFALSTAAVRMAKNQKYFLELVKQKLGFEFKVLSGSEEAYYDYLGVVNTIVFEDAILVDVGGGSTEIIRVKNRQIEDAISLPYGSVILTEHFSKEKSQKKQIEAADEFFKDQIKALKWLDDLKDIPVIGLGGINRSVGKVSKNAHNYPIDNLHNYMIKRRELDEIIDKIQATDPSDMDKIKGINKRRADIMALGITPLKVIAEYCHATELIISAYGLRDGFFFEYLNQQRGQSVVVEDVLAFSVDNMMKRFYVNRNHASQVDFLSSRLFDLLSPLHDFTSEEKKVLSVAAKLHDIGTHIAYYDHHLHGLYIIMNSKIDGLTNLEQLSVAYLVGNHRMMGIKDSFKPYEAFLDKDFFNRLNKLAVLLQIAEHLDRAENSNVEAVEGEITDDNVYLKLVAKTFPEFDIESAMRFAPKFEKYYHRQLEIYV